MGQFPTLKRIMPLLRIESAVVAAVLVFAVLWYYQDQQIFDVREEAVGLERRLQIVTEDLTFAIASDDSNDLEEQLSELRSAQRGPLGLPSLESAASFGDKLLIYLDEQQLNVLGFGKTETVATVGGKDYQAIRYAIATQGTGESLVGLLKLLEDFPTAAVQSLTLAKPIEGSDNWELALELDLFYGDGEF